MTLSFGSRLPTPLAIAILLVSFACSDPPETPPLSEEEEVRQAFDAFMDASLDRDYARVWGMTARSTREHFEWHLERLRSLDPSDADRAKPWRELLEDAGLVQEDVLSMSPKDYFIATMEGRTNRQPDEWSRQKTAARQLVIEEIRLRNWFAYVRCNHGSDWALTAFFRKDDGEWRFWYGGDRSLFSGGMLYRPLERKVSAYLPKQHIRFDRIGLVIEVGGDAIGKSTLAHLWRRVRELADERIAAGRDLPAVVLEVGPDLSMQGFMQVLDTVHLVRVREIHFADTTDAGPSPGVRLNGVPLEEIEDMSVLPDPFFHSALERIIGAAPSEKRRLERLREQRR